MKTFDSFGWLLTSSLLILTLNASGVDKSTIERQRRADVATTDAIVQAAYESISGPVSRERDWERMRHLWLDSARIILSSNDYEGRVRWENLSLDEFIFRVSIFYKNEGFFEREITSTTHRFGNVAQVWSTFEIRKGSFNGPLIYRGINSWQLAWYNGRWWITQLVYDVESRRYPLPDRYLKK